MLAKPKATGDSAVGPREGEPPDRDLRIDFIRGGALLLIYSDHVKGNLLSEFTLYSVGFADMAEVFVFVSGYVGGMVYSRRLARDGFWSCQKKSLRRAAQLYLAHLAGLAALIAALAILSMAAGGKIGGIHWYRRFMETPARSIADLLLLYGQPRHFAILPLYMSLLPILPAALAVGQMSIAAPLTASFLLYLAVQLFPEWVALPPRWERDWVFNPFAWQFLYLGAAFLGAWPAAKRRIPGNVVALILALGVLEASFVLQMVWPRSSIPWIGKPNLEPLRLIYFACLFIVGRSLFRRDRPAWRFCNSPFAKPLILCGQNPLAVFCTGAVLSTVVSWLLVPAAFDLWGQAVLNLAGWSACVAAAALSRFTFAARREAASAPNRPSRP